MSKYIKTKQVLVRAREEIIGELIRTGESGGTGLAQRYAPLLVNLQNAIDVVDKLDNAETLPLSVKPTPVVKAPSTDISFAEKMKTAKAAKKLAVEAK